MSRKPEKLVLVLQGGGALGAYQAGAYEALAEAGMAPDWIAGISIGAINAAIIAGNPPERRVERLRTLWERASLWLRGEPVVPGHAARGAFNQMSAAIAAIWGVPGLFAPRVIPPFLQPQGSREALSFYDTLPLANSLAELVDFDRLNNGAVRLSVGAVHIKTGNFAYFDTAERKLAAAHIMASGALPPGLPPVLIDGEAYWDGGLVSNTPLQYVLGGEGPREDLCVFQIDLFSARGKMPQNLRDVAMREKDIRYSSRTRLNTDMMRKRQSVRHAMARLVEKLPPELRQDPDAALLAEWANQAAVTIVHLINRRSVTDGETLDYEFSRLTVEEHWNAGRNDVRRTLAHAAWRDRQRPTDGVLVLDLTKNDDPSGIGSRRS
jgi:NTE family protein